MLAIGVIALAALAACGTEYNAGLHQAMARADQQATVALNNGDWAQARQQLLSAIASIQPGTDAYYGDLSLVYSHSMLLSRVGYTFLMQNDIAAARQNYDSAITVLAVGTRKHNALTRQSILLDPISIATAGLASRSASAARPASVLATTPAPGTELEPKDGIAADGVRFVTFGGFRIFSSIGRVTAPGKFCTGTVVGYELVLTAAHCVTSEDGRPLAGQYTFWPSSEIPIRLDKRPSVPVLEIHTAHGKSWDRLPFDDWAFLVLASHPRSPLDPNEFVGIAGPSDAPVLLSGPHGLTTDGSMVAAGYSHDIHNAGFLTVDWGCLPIRRFGTILLTTCVSSFGASGGPMFAIKDGNAALIGTISFIRPTGAGEPLTGVVLDSAWKDELYRLRAAHPLPRGLYSATAGYCGHDPADCL